MEYIKNFPDFGKKIENYVIHDHIQDLMASGFKDISLFYIQKTNIDYYFTNGFFEKKYLEEKLIHKDLRIQALYASKAVFIPWTSLAQQDYVLKQHKEICQISNGLSLLDFINSETALILHLGFLEEEGMENVISCETTLKYLFFNLKNITQTLQKIKIL